MTRVLLIDNENAQLQSLAYTLGNAGMGVESVNCVFSAIEHLHTQSVDLVISASTFKTYDVLDFLELRKQSNRAMEVPVVILGASGRNKLECYRLGCDEYISLPMDTAEILFRICAVLRRAPRAGISGTFQHLNLVELVQLLVGARRSGRLIIDTKIASGSYYFFDGQVIHALEGELLGEEAFLSLLKASRSDGGQFLFSAFDLWSGEASIAKRTDHLLLELASAIDEENF